MGRTCSVSRRSPVSARSLLAVVLALLSALLAVVTGPASPATAAGAGGYWLVGSDGVVTNFGDARFFGSLGGLPLAMPIVGMSPTPSGRGYWLVASDGGIFAFGDAGFFGSTGAIRLNRAIVGMASTPSGRGYWLVASDGGIFAFGDAGFFGSTGAINLTRPIAGMATTPSGHGYWMSATDGGIFAFGDAGFLGSAAGRGATNDIMAMAPTATGRGYWQVASDGELFSFGDAPDAGRTHGRVIGIGAVPAPVIPSAPLGARFLDPPPPVTTTTSTTAPVPPPPDPLGNPVHAYALPPGPAPPANPLAPMADPKGVPYTPAGAVVCGLPVTAATTVPQPDPTIHKEGLVGELSGQVSSVAYPGAIWAIRDSGHPASLWLLTFDSSGVATTREFPVPGADDHDWEDLTYFTGADGRGHLYATESGQGGSATVIYEILEPNPATDTTATLLHRFPYAYPDKKSNTEAAFMFDGHLVLAKKSMPHAWLYQFDTLKEGVVNKPVFVGKLLFSKGPSMARVSPDGRMLVASTHDTVTVYCNSGAAGLAAFTGHNPDAFVENFYLDNVESGDFYPAGSTSLLFISEAKNVLQLPAFVSSP
jgi:hypothetical protein